MKHQWKGFLSGVLVTMLAIGLIGTAAAAGRQTQATLNYTGINITYNGAKVTPTDAKGNPVEPFIINGTTYLPLRGVAQILGLNVAWDATSNTAALTDGSASTTSPFTLSAGQYTVGKDIQAGKYDCRAISGSGNFMGNVSSQILGTLNELLAAETETTAIQMGYHPAYSNLELKAGDTIYIGGSLTVQFTAK